MTCFISTGAKQVLHTLWTYNIVKRPGLGGGFIQYCYIKNLPVNEEEAERIAKEYAKNRDIKYTGIEDSPTHKRASHIEAYGVQFKHKRKNGKPFYFGIATQEFFDAWKADKQQMKDNGFSLSKFKNPIRNVEEWYVFYKQTVD